MGRMGERHDEDLAACGVAWGVRASRLLRHTPCGVEAVAGQGGLMAFPLLCYLLRIYMASYCYDLEGPSARWSCGLK